MLKLAGLVWCGFGFIFAGAQLEARAEPWTAGGIEDPKAFNTSWHPVNYNFHFNRLPLEGSVQNEHIPWGDSYWPSQLGGLAYRWNQFQINPPSTQLTGDERKKLYFDVHRYSRKELLGFSTEERRKVVAGLSPLEKFSILKGDYSYALVDAFTSSKDPFKESWMGYCHAWAPVSLHYPEPNPVTRINDDGIEVQFGSADVKAVMIASYADRVRASFNTFISGIGRRVGNVIRRIGGQQKEDKDSAFVGKRCGRRFIYPMTKIKDGKEVFSDYGDTSGILDADYEAYLRGFQEKAIELHYTPDAGPKPTDPDFIAKALENSRDPACNDVNAGAFHIVIANQIGLMKEGILIDKTRDVEVWNQPAFRYRSTVTEWLDPSEQSAPGTARVAHVKTRLYYADDTDYGWAFWFPGLPGLFGFEPNFQNEYDRYQRFLLKEGDITEASHYPEGVIDYTDYEYTLDLAQDSSILGGDWITFDRPDFLWIFRKASFQGDFAKLNEIYQPVKLPADATLTR
jgi:hypothetical protein